MLPKKLSILLLVIGIALHSHALNVRITTAGGYQADGRWLAAATSMGHNASIEPVSILDNTSFFASTDILIISTGMFAFSPAQIATIQSFLLTGKSVYLQGEYQASLPGNQAFSQIVNAMGGSFTWGAALNGNLSPSIIGSMGNTTLGVTALPYFFYGCTGSSSCNVMAFIVTGGMPVGWMFQSPMPNAGRLIFTTDQDWVGASNVYTSCLLLMKNVLSHLADKNVGDQNPVPMASITASPGNTICEGSAVTFTAATLNTGLAPVYQWKKNGNNVGNNSATYIGVALQNGDVLSCTIGGCASAAANSNNITMTVHALDTVSVIRSVCASQLPYTWNGITVPAGGNAAATFTTPSLVTGCDSTAVLNLTVNPVYVRDIDTLVCYTAMPFAWSTQSLPGSGSYTDTFTTVAGCDSVVTLHLQVSPSPVFTTSDLSACVSLDFEGYTYDQSTVIHDTLHSVRGCDSVYRTINIQVRQPVSDTIRAAICAGDRYRFDGRVYDSEGEYVHTGTAANGCDSFSVLSLSIHALPQIAIEDHDHKPLCIGDTLLLTAAGGASYEWFCEDKSLGTGGEIKLLLPRHNNHIRLAGKDDNQCGQTEERTYIADACCTLMMPNAFSPNGDGLNDKFGPVTSGHPEAFRMLIFNRWGQKLYTSFEAANGWDGTVGGKLAEPGVYFYKIESKCVDGVNSSKQGDLVLIR